MARKTRPVTRTTSAKSKLVPASQVASLADAVQRLCVYLVRESTQYNAAMLIGMISKVLSGHLAAKPHLQAIIDAAPNLVRRDKVGEFTRALHQVADILTPSGVWVGWEIALGEDRVLICPASAAEVDENEMNDFTEGYIAWLRRNRPKHVYTGPFSRQGRRVAQLARIRDILIDCGIAFSCHEAQDLKVADQAGAMVWGMLAQMSENEWLNIVERNFAGKIFAAKCGKYPNGKQLLPLGYDKSEKGIVFPAGEKVAALVAAMLEAAAVETDAEKLIETWDSLGVPRMRWNERDKDRGKTIGSLASPARSLVLRRLAWLDTYATGQHTLVLENPLPAGHTLAFHGVDVMVDEDDENDSGRVFIDLDFGLPTRTLEDGTQMTGFVSAETIAKVKANWAPTGECGVCEVCLSAEPLLDEDGNERSCVKAVARATKTGGKPLAWTPSWVEDGFEWRLLCPQGYYYALHRRPLSRQGQPWSVNRAIDGECVATARVTELHKMMGEAIAGPAPSVVVRGGGVKSPEEVLAARERLAELRENATQARTQAQVLRSTMDSAGENAAVFEQMAVSKEAEAAEAEAEADRIESELRAEVELSGEGDDVEIDGGALAAIVAQLLQGPKVLPAASTRALRTMVGQTLRAKASHGTVTVSFGLRVPAANSAGSVTLGGLTPYQVSVPNKLTHNRYTGPTLADKANEALERMMTSTVRLSQIAAEFGWVEGTARNNLNEVFTAMLPNAAARSALIDCPLLEPRAIVWEKLTGKRVEALYADGGPDAGYRSMVEMTYLDPLFSWASWWASDTHEKRRQILEYMRAHREESDENGGFDTRELSMAFDLTAAQFRQIRNPQKTKRQIAAAYPRVMTTLQLGNHLQPTLVSAVRCPHCDADGVVAWADHVLRVPELPDAVICRRCRRMPTRSAVYPRGYLEYWVGSRGLEGTRGRVAAAFAGDEDAAQVAERRYAGTTPGEPPMVPPRHRVLAQLAAASAKPSSRAS